MKDNEILQLWSDPKFSGSFSSAKTFQTNLYLEKNIWIPLYKLYQILSQNVEFESMIRPKKNFKRRKYEVNGFFKLCQADLAQMYEYNGFNYFLCFIDVFSHRIFTSPLKSKSPKEVITAYKVIFKDFGTPEEIQADQGECKVITNVIKILILTLLF